MDFRRIQDPFPSDDPVLFFPPPATKGSAAVPVSLELGAAAPFRPTAAGGRGLGLRQEQHGISAARRIDAHAVPLWPFLGWLDVASSLSSFCFFEVLLFEKFGVMFVTVSEACFLDGWADVS